MNENPEKTYKCEYCGKEFDSMKKRGGHITAKHKLKFCNICENYISSGNYNKHIKSCEKIHKSYYCKKCGKLVTKKFGSGIFCSRKCANSHIQTDEQNKRRSIKLKSNPCGVASFEYRSIKKQLIINKLTKYLENPNRCKVCGIPLEYSHRFNNTCSKRCRKIFLKGRVGGYREGSGRGKSGHYKGIYCSSTYELVYLIYCLDHNIPIKRFDKCLYYKNEKYYPDFIVNGRLIEIKGYKSKNFYKQIDVAKQNGYNVIVKFRQDLQKEFDWVKNNYKYKNLVELYDKYPYFEYTCDFCGTLFKSVKPRTSKHKFCSRSCSGNFKSITI